MPHYSHSGKAGGHYSSHKSHSDVVGHASELVPIVASSSLRYGERITAPGAGAPQPALVSRPIHRHRTHRNRNSNLSKVEYSPPSTTPTSIADDYAYQPPQSSYEPDVNSPQVESMKIAIIPVKASDFSDLNEQSQSQAQLPPKQSFDSALPENLLNYIRQMQGLTQPDKSQNNANPTSQSATSSEQVQPSNESFDQNNFDKWQPKENLTEMSVSSKPVTSHETVPLLTHLPPQKNSINIEHQQNYSPNIVSSHQASISATPIQNQWQQNFATPIQASKPIQYQASDYVYRPPELKVMRNLPRYNPKLEEYRPRVNTPVIAPLRQSFSSQVPSNSISDSQLNTAPIQPQKSQFLYSVSHSSNPPYTFSGANQYLNSDNFGLTAFHQSQLKQQIPTNKSGNYLSPSLTAAASVESAKWIKPPNGEKTGKSKFFNNFGHRLSQLF